MCRKYCKILLIALFVLGVAWFVVDYLNPLTPMPAADDTISGAGLAVCFVCIVLAFESLNAGVSSVDRRSHAFADGVHPLVSEPFQTNCCLLI